MFGIESIRLYMSDWQYNAGLVGLVNILKHSGESIEIRDQYVEIKKEQLGNFAHKYFDYMISTHEKNISWYRIISYEDRISFFANENYENFNEKSLEDLNKYIKDVLKKYIKSNSYVKVYKLLDDDIGILEREKDLKQIRVKKKETLEDRIEDIKETMDKIEQIIEFFKSEEVKKYVAGVNIVYTLVKNAWNGVCFLNSQTKEKDFYVDYENYFVEPVREYVEADKSRYKYNCFNCDLKMKDMKNDLGFLNQTGFDVSRKPSHVWNFYNDVAICDVCKLVYSCMPAGFTYVYNKGMFVNDNATMKDLIRTNGRIKKEVFYENGERGALTYKALIHSINSQWEKTAKYDFADVQVVRYENEKYKFNILSKSMLKVVDRSKKHLENIIKATYKEDSEYVSVYEEVVDRILNNQNLFTLIHKAVLYSITSPGNVYYNTRQLETLIKINVDFMKEMGHMNGVKSSVVDDSRVQGYWLREGYLTKGSKDKVNGISYRLLNALKTSNEEMFMDTLLNCYLYVKKPVPKMFMDCLKDEDAFKTIGYAFVAGLNSHSENNGEDKK